MILLLLLLLLLLQYDVTMASTSTTSKRPLGVGCIVLIVQDACHVLTGIVTYLIHCPGLLVQLGNRLCRLGEAL